MDNLLDCLHRAGVCQKATQATSQTRLGDFDGWDSMTAVNFSIALESRYDVKLLDDGIIFTNDNTLSDVARVLADRGVPDVLL